MGWLALCPRDSAVYDIIHSEEFAFQQKLNVDKISNRFLTSCHAIIPTIIDTDVIYNVHTFCD